MATAAVTLPRARRRRRNEPVTGRAPLPEIYVVKPIDNSRLRREVDPRKRTECFRLLGMGILFFTFIFLYAHQHFQCVRYGYQIEKLKAERASLEECNHRLRLEEARLTDPERIDRLARERLGLAPIGSGQLRHLDAIPSPLAPPGHSELARNFAAGSEISRVP